MANKGQLTLDRSHVKNDSNRYRNDDKREKKGQWNIIFIPYVVT